MEVLVFLGAMAIFATIGALIGETRGGSGQGAVLGALFGPFGWLIIVLWGRTDPEEVERLRAKLKE